MKQERAGSETDLLARPGADAAGSELGDRTAEERARQSTELQQVYTATGSTVETSFTGQRFGKIELDKSIGMQGIVGAVQRGVNQEFGDFKASNESKGFQGQLDGDSFAKMFELGDRAAGGRARPSTELQQVYTATCGTTEASLTGQRFGKMELDKSIGMQGIVGAAQRGVNQQFGDFKVSNESKGFQGQLDGDSSAKIFT